MNRLSDLKDQYENIKASDKLKERIVKTMRNEKRKRVIIKSSTGLVASLVIATMLAVNFIPSLAYAMSDIPVIGSIVKVITFGRYEIEENGYMAKIVTPKIEGLLDKDLEKRLNGEFKENANSIILAFEV